MHFTLLYSLIQCECHAKPLPVFISILIFLWTAEWNHLCKRAGKRFAMFSVILSFTFEKSGAAFSDLVFIQTFFMLLLNVFLELNSLVFYLLHWTYFNSISSNTSRIHWDSCAKFEKLTIKITIGAYFRNRVFGEPVYWNLALGTNSRRMSFSWMDFRFCERARSLTAERRYESVLFHFTVGGCAYILTNPWTIL